MGGSRDSVIYNRRRARGAGRRSEPKIMASSTSAVRDQIPVVAATGTGATRLAAFHAALVAVDLGHYNLVRLSSVIPPDTSVDATGKAPVPAGGWGDRLYCVYAEQVATTAGEQAWAGVGWVQRLDGGGGLFVEHEGDGEEAVADAIRASLRDLVAGQEDLFTEPDWVLGGAVCAGEPVCSLVIAPYETAPWNGAACG
jgi:arginine decarboxylase